MSYIQRRPFTVIALCVGIILAGFIVFRSETVRTIVKEVQTGKREKNPCDGLNERSCALKLFASLPKQDREKIRDLSDKQVRRLLRRELRKERLRQRRARQGRQKAPETGSRSPRPPGPTSGTSGGTGDNPGAPAVPPGSPSLGGTPPTSGGGGGFPGTPSPPPRPPLTGPIRTPPIGPVGPVEVRPPSIEGVPCTPIPPLTDC